MVRLSTLYLVAIHSALNHLRVAVAQLLDDSSKVCVPGVPEDDRNALIGKALTGEDGGGIISLDHGLNGYVINKTLMIERTGRSDY
ncbi:hypothetical protein [Slackia isoflavoniconvertens]|uniref:hypothetical protein n=1 Tax=Slackia isoflavoniconvertens TaxID=572010 RepID=UPI003AF0A641